MPKLNDNMDDHGGIGHFGFSAVRADELGSSEYTLVTICVDVSGSIASFSAGLENALKESIKALKFSPRANCLLVRIVKFSSTQEEIHGYKLLKDINLADYDGVLDCGGATVLCDASVNAIESIRNYTAILDKQDIGNVNGIVIVITDGEDNGSKLGVTAIAKAKTDCINLEMLESILTILVAVNSIDPHFSGYLKSFERDGKFDQMIELENLDSNSLAKLAKFISKSISCQSQSLGSGGPSKTIDIGSLTI